MQKPKKYPVQWYIRYITETKIPHKFRIQLSFFHSVMSVEILKILLWQFRFEKMSKRTVRDRHRYCLQEDMGEACGVGWELEGYNIHKSWDYQGMVSVQPTRS